MCGIFGCIGRKLPPGKVEYCCDTMAHRGPDGRGIWEKEDVALAHRRLSILDITDSGRQPMPYADDRYWIVFNGEIYNYIELKEELSRKGYLFTSDSDTEVILAAYCAWGQECVQRFNGMWAFAIYDSHRKHLFMSRDRFGVKPLFYFLGGGYLIFASEMKAIAPCLDNPQINHGLIDFYRILHHYEFKEDCLIKGIKKIPAGCNAIYENGKLQIKKYWETLDHRMEVPKTYSEQVEMFRELFTDACRLRMRSDVPIGTSLSGGLDSSAVICTMSMVASGDDRFFQKDWQHAYVAGFRGSVLDETMFAQKVVDHIGIKSASIEIQNDLTEEKLYRQAYLFEELWMNSQIPQMCIYENERKNGTVVSIDGHGADELFGGYGINMQFALLDAADRASLEETAGTIYRAEKVVDGDVDLEGWLRLRLRKTKVRNLYEESVYRKWILRKCFSDSADFQKLDHLTRALYIETHFRILQTMLRNYDRDSMAHGVEIRMPFMDHRIVSFAFSIPWDSKMRNGFSKAIIRDALREAMPEEIAYRSDKKGFNAPIGEWIRDSAELYLDLVSSSSFLNSSVIRNPARVRKKLYDFIHKKNHGYVDDFNKAQRLWMDLGIYVWEQAVAKRLGA